MVHPITKQQLKIGKETVRRARVVVKKTGCFYKCQRPIKDGLWILFIGRVKWFLFLGFMIARGSKGLLLPVGVR